MVTPGGKVTLLLAHGPAGKVSEAVNVILTGPFVPSGVSPGASVPLPEEMWQLAIPIALGGPPAEAVPESAMTSSPIGTSTAAVIVSNFRSMEGPLPFGPLTGDRTPPR